MRNYIKPGKTMSFTAPAGGVTSGVPVLIGALLVVPVASVAEGQTFEGVTEGVFTIAKAAGAAWTEGQLLYWDTANSNIVTAHSATARRVGVASAAALNAAVTGEVRLSGVPSPANVA